VLARGQRRSRDLGVQVARRTDVDDVDVVALEHSAPVGRPLAPAQLVRGGRHPVGVAPDDHALLEGGNVERRRDLTPGIGVRSPHEGIADHGDAERAPLSRGHPASGHPVL